MSTTEPTDTRNKFRSISPRYQEVNDYKRAEPRELSKEAIQRLVDAMPMPRSKYAGADDKSAWKVPQSKPADCKKLADRIARLDKQRNQILAELAENESAVTKLLDSLGTLNDDVMDAQEALAELDTNGDFR